MQTNNQQRSGAIKVNMEHGRREVCGESHSVNVHRTCLYIASLQREIGVWVLSLWTPNPFNPAHIQPDELTSHSHFMAPYNYPDHPPTSICSWKTSGCAHTWHSLFSLGSEWPSSFTNTYTSSPQLGQAPFMATTRPLEMLTSELAG